MKLLAWRILILDIMLVAAAALLTRYNLVVLAPFVILIAELYRRDAGVAPMQYLQNMSTRWLGSIALVALASLQPQPAAKVAMIIGLAAWTGWHELKTSGKLLIVGAAQFLVLWALFLAAAIWNWPTMLVILFSYASAYLLARRLLGDQRAASVLALAWGLIVAQISWVFLVWLVSYIVGNGFALVPQAAVVITALGYCFGGIYTAHADSKLSRGRLAEYLIIGLILILVVVAGTRWSGAI